MIAVIFEVLPKEGKMDEYVDLAKQIRSELTNAEGFISVERFQSISEPDKLLSLSFWDSEESVAKWRNNTAHRMAQQHGRNNLFADYRLRVASVLRDYGIDERLEAPKDSAQR